ncbi:MAG: hypothetical protein OEM27_03860 [Nitrospinota bacterium]|nr:hypothetical protein [Nitrospinota bacterium]
MKWRINMLIGLLCTTLPGTAWATGWDDYDPATLSDITAQYTSHLSASKSPKGAVTLNLHAGGEPFRSTVLFLGKVRNIQPDRSSLIEMWGKSLGIDTARGNYKKEIQVREKNKTYWLPIQEILVSHLKREVKKNGEVMLFMVYIGTTGKTPVFLVNEFRGF